MQDAGRKGRLRAATLSVLLHLALVAIIIVGLEFSEYHPVASQKGNVIQAVVMPQNRRSPPPPKPAPEPVPQPAPEPEPPKPEPIKPQPEEQQRQDEERRVEKEKKAREEKQQAELAV